MSFHLASTRLTSLGVRTGFPTTTTLGVRTGFPTTTRLGAIHQRNMSTNNNTDTIIFGRKIEKRFFYSVLAVLGAVEGYFYYSTYFKTKDVPTPEQNKSIEDKSVN